VIKKKGGERGAEERYPVNHKKAAPNTYEKRAKKKKEGGRSWSRREKGEDGVRARRRVPSAALALGAGRLKKETRCFLFLKKKKKERQGAWGVIKKKRDQARGPALLEKRGQRKRRRTTTPALQQKRKSGSSKNYPASPASERSITPVYKRPKVLFPAPGKSSWSRRTYSRARGSSVPTVMTWRGRRSVSPLEKKCELSTKSIGSASARSPAKKIIVIKVP